MMGTLPPSPPTASPANRPRSPPAPSSRRCRTGAPTDLHGGTDDVHGGNMKTEMFVALAEGLLAAGSPLDGVGIQLHISDVSGFRCTPGGAED